MENDTKKAAHQHSEQPSINDLSVAQGENEVNQKLRVLHPARPTVPRLATVSLTDLLDTAYESTVPIVDNLLYAGTYLFVGAPKVGKSFLMAQLAYHVSQGQPLWGYQTHQGAVLYLALEDGHSRLQKRLARMFGTGGDDSLYFAIESQKLQDGLLGQLDAFIQQHPNTRLIIVDTLQKIRELGEGKLSYGKDYEIVAALKKFSDRHRICLLVVHHTRKQGADDSFDSISGTNGLLGAADGAFVLQKEKRTDNKATLDIVGRDQPDQRLHLTFERECCLWRLIKAEKAPWKEPPDPLLEAVAKLVTADAPKWAGTASELSALLNVHPVHLIRRLNIGKDVLQNEFGIVYENGRSHVGRQVTLTLSGRP